MSDVRISVGDQNKSTPLFHITGENIGKRNPLHVTLVNISGDIYSAGGGSGGAGGDGAINDGADSNIKATVRNTGGAKPLHVILTNISGDTYNIGTGGGGGDGAILDGANASIKATVKQYASSNPQAVVLVNVSGDVYNASGGGGSSNGTIVDGVNSNIKATVLSGPTTRPDGSSNPLVVQVADDLTRLLGRIFSPIGVQVVGGAVGGSVGITGDVYANQRGAWATSITGDVLLRENAGINIGNVTIPQTLGVQVIGGVSSRVSISGDQLNTFEQNKVGVHVASGQLGVSGDVYVNQRGAWGTAITGDVLLRANPNTNIGQVTIPTPVGVQVVGGVGNRVSISGDQLNVTVLNKVGTHVASGQVGVSGDVYVNQRGGWAVGITGDINYLKPTTDAVHVHSGRIGVTGDVSTIPKSGQTWPVREQGVIGVYSVGGQVGGKVGVTGDVTSVQKGGWAVTITGDIIYLDPTTDSIHVNSGRIGVTGDISTTPKAGQTWPVMEQGVIGVQILGGQSGGSSGITGDVNVIQKGAWGVALTGDRSITDGSDPTIKATVRDYPNSNPLAVALTNVSGDTYSPTPKEPICVTRSGRISASGSTQIAGPYTGRVIKVCNYSLQGEADTSFPSFNSGASGEQLTPQWMLGAREGATKDVTQVGGGYIFKTQQGQALSLELMGQPVRYSVTFHTGDSF